MATEPKTKLTIVYSPHYDGETYLGDAPEAMGTLYVGNKGLMEHSSQFKDIISIVGVFLKSPAFLG